MNNPIYTIPSKSHTEEEEEKMNVVSHSDDNKRTVVVTGASGFVASWTIKYLLEKGYRVIGTVRGDPKSYRYKEMMSLSPSGVRG